jgi:two-component system response regulator (stage 0 sporulation protein A)
VDDNEDFRTIMEMYAEKLEEFELIGTAKDGFEGVEKITNLKPDIVILDMIMPNLDGLGVLEKLKNIGLEKEPTIFILSAVGNDNNVKKALTYGVEYYFVKPIEIAYIFERIKTLIIENNVNDESIYLGDNTTEFNKLYKFAPKGNNILDDNFEKGLLIEISTQLYEAGIPPHMLGYRYLIEAVFYAINKNTPFTSITKELYPAISQIFATTPQKVERGIRNCIEKAWQRCSQDSMDSLLGYTSNNVKSKPTNSEFIAMITEKVKICYRKNSNV